MPRSREWGLVVSSRLYLLKTAREATTGVRRRTENVARRVGSMVASSVCGTGLGFDRAVCPGGDPWIQVEDGPEATVGRVQRLDIVGRASVTGRTSAE